ncbi:MAG: hypothetical protein ABFS45_11730 [Pseudomonadota bacterium]
MDSLITDLATIHPSLAFATKYAIAALVWLVAWLIISVPIALAHFASIVPISTFQEYLRERAEVLYKAVTRTLAAVYAVPERFHQIFKLKYVFDHNQKILRNQIVSVGKQLRTSCKKIGNHQFHTKSALTGLLREITKFNAQSLPQNNLNELEPPALIEDVSNRRGGLTKLLVGVIGGGGMIIINTFMLNEFFRSFISVRISSIPISVILSIFFSAMELILGMLLFWQQQHKQQSIRTPLAEVGLLILIAFLMLIEGFFYMALSAPMSSVLETLFAPYELPTIFKFWLAPLGFVVVGVLVYTGHLIIEGLHKLSRSAVGSIHRHYKRTEQHLDRVLEKVTQAKKDLEEFKTAMISLGGGNSLLVQEINKQIDRAHEICNDIPPMTHNAYVELDERDVARFYSINVMFLVMVSAVMVVFVWAQFLFLQEQSFMVASPPWLNGGIAAAETLVLLSASYIIMSPLRNLTNQKSMENLRAAKWLFIIGIAVAAITVIIVFNLILVTNSEGIRNWLWFFILLATTFALVLVGGFVPSIIVAAFGIINAFFYLIAVVIIGLVWLILHLLSFLLQVLGIILYIGGFPAIVLWRRFTEKKISTANAKSA